MQIQTQARPRGLHDGAPRTRVESLPEVVALVGEELAAAERALAQAIEVAIPAVEEMGRYLVDAGGKRLRPLLTALGARAVGLDDAPAELFCIGELVHLGSLLHDDVVDQGRERRGRAAAWTVYGNPGVVLAGDFCVARALELAARHTGLAGVRSLARVVAQMSQGEVTQLLNKGNLDLDPATYHEVIRQKSACLIAWCVAAGAHARGDAEAAEALESFGLAVGEAFQITDDVLDYTGKKRFTGKRRGQDLAEGKPTLPLLLALDRVPHLRERLAAGPPSPERVPGILREVCASGATDQALGVARARVEAGLDALGRLAASPWRDALAAMARHMVERVA